MSHRIFTALAALAALAVLAGVCVESAAQQRPELELDPDPEPVEHVLLLHNHEVVRGRMYHGTDHWVILPPEGGRIRIADRTVDAAFRTLQEAYRHRAAGTSSESVLQQQELARWCLHYGLLDRAARHVIRIRELDPDNPGADWLERNIVAANLPRRFSPPASKRPEPAPISRAKAPAGLLPPRAVEMFTTTIQPILMNRCATAACHGSSRTESDFRLTRPLLGQPIRQATTQRNLASVLYAIDKDRPRESPLLAAGRGSHAQLGRAVFGVTDERQYAKLVAWVGYVTGTDIQPMATRPGDPSVQNGRLLSESPAGASGSQGGSP